MIIMIIMIYDASTPDIFITFFLILKANPCIIPVEFEAFCPSCEQPHSLQGFGGGSYHEKRRGPDITYYNIHIAVGCVGHGTKGHRCRKCSTVSNF